MFSEIADFVLNCFNIDVGTKFGTSLHFFVEDTLKIFILIYVMLFIVTLFRERLSPEKIREYLNKRSRIIGYLLAVMLGVITPFCSCSSIPLFIGFISAGIPFGMAMTFIISSPLISEIAAVMLFITPEAGALSAFVYILAGAVIAIIGGFLCDKLGFEKYALHSESHKECCSHCHSHKEKIKSLISEAHEYAFSTLKTIWLYVLLGLIVGALMHGYIPEEYFIKYLGAENPFGVIVAAFVGIPIYANHDSILPILHVLLIKQVPIGTSIVVLMSTTAISLPEMIMLNKVLSWKLLTVFCVYLFVSFIIVGYLINAILM